ncbi:MAG: zinc ribbon domain-containing protein [Eggerthellaceae bacterium]|nr:zinc ribbon domain-containing protein [Eggerthellaceae bacterium]
MICPKCGSYVSDQAFFCGECGQDLKANSSVQVDGDQGSAPLAQPTYAQVPDGQVAQVAPRVSQGSAQPAAGQAHMPQYQPAQQPQQFQESAPPYVQPVPGPVPQQPQKSKKGLVAALVAAAIAVVGIGVAASMPKGPSENEVREYVQAQLDASSLGTWSEDVNFTNIKDRQTVLDIRKQEIDEMVDGFGLFPEWDNKSREHAVEFFDSLTKKIRWKAGDVEKTEDGYNVEVVIEPIDLTHITEVSILRGIVDSQEFRELRSNAASVDALTTGANLIAFKWLEENASSPGYAAPVVEHVFVYVDEDKALNTKVEDEAALYGNVVKYGFGELDEEGAKEYVQAFADLVSGEVTYDIDDIWNSPYAEAARERVANAEVTPGSEGEEAVIDLMKAEIPLFHLEASSALPTSKGYEVTLVRKAPDFDAILTDEIMEECAQRAYEEIGNEGGDNIDQRAWDRYYRLLADRAIPLMKEAPLIDLSTEVYSIVKDSASGMYTFEDESGGIDDMLEYDGSMAA